jgi:hypothetical protein
MKKVILTIMVIVGILPAANVLAKTKCPAAKIQQVYSTEDKVFIQLEGQAWQTLGAKSDADTAMKLNMALRAKQQEQIVELQMDGNIDDTCLSADTSIYVDKIKVRKKEKYRG